MRTVRKAYFTLQDAPSTSDRYLSSNILIDLTDCPLLSIRRQKLVGRQQTTSFFKFRLQSVLPPILRPRGLTQRISSCLVLAEQHHCQSQQAAYFFLSLAFISFSFTTAPSKILRICFVCSAHPITVLHHSTVHTRPPWISHCC